MKTLITGCSGLVGNSLLDFLFKQGHSIQCLKRDAHRTGGNFWATASLPDSEHSFDAVVHLAGENVASSRWTAAKKESILRSRLDGTRDLVDYLAQLPERPKVLVCASAVGYYGSRGDEILDESSSLGSGFLADVCERWEKEAQRAASLGIRVVNLRFGMVLSPNGGALHKMLPAFKANLGGVVGSGRQFVSWISIRDLVSIIDFVIKNEQIKGAVNVVSPIPTTNKELTIELGRALERITLFKVPAIMAKLVFGEMAEEMLLCSARVTPRVLLEAGYTFQDQSLGATLRYCIGK